MKRYLFLVVAAIICFSCSCSGSGNLQTFMGMKTLILSENIIVASPYSVTITIDSSKQISGNVTGHFECSSSATIPSDEYTQLVSLISEADLINYSEPECAEVLVGVGMNISYTIEDNRTNAFNIKCGDDSKIKNILDKISLLEDQLLTLSCLPGVM